jgi:hypothetical protein
MKVAHVVSSTKFAVKCEDAGVDAIVAEGLKPEATTEEMKPQHSALFPM